MVSASISVICGKSIGPFRQQGDHEPSSPDEKLSCDPEPRSGERYIAWGVSPRIRARIKEKSAERRQKYRGDTCGSWHNRCLSPPPGASRLFVVLTLGLRTAFGRRDAPSPASGRWPAIPDLGHVSLPPAGSRPRLRICRSSGAPPQVSTYFRTRHLPVTCFRDLVSDHSGTGKNG